MAAEAIAVARASDVRVGRVGMGGYCFFVRRCWLIGGDSGWELVVGGQESGVGSWGTVVWRGWGCWPFDIWHVISGC